MNIKGLIKCSYDGSVVFPVGTKTGIITTKIEQDIRHEYNSREMPGKEREETC